MRTPRQNENVCVNHRPAVKLLKVIKWSYDLVTFSTFNPGPTYSLELGVWLGLYSCCMTRRCPLHPNFPRCFSTRKHHPGFRKKPPVSLSGTPPGRPWTKQETDNSTIQMASSFPKKLHDGLMIVAGSLWNLPGFFVAPCKVPTMKTILPPQKKSNEGGRALKGDMLVPRRVKCHGNET